MGGRFSSCYLIQGSKNILLDAGPQVLPALLRAGLKPADIDIIAISHLHPDHMGGLSFLMLEDLWITKRTKPIQLLVPNSGKKLITDICKVYYSPEDVEHIPSVFNFRVFEVGDILTVDGIKFTAIEATHSAEPKMILVEIDGIKIGYSGDTAYNEESFLNLLDADLTIHECSSYDIPIPNHVNYLELQSHVQKLIEMGRISESKRIYLSHVDDSLIDAKEEITVPFVLAFDSMELDI